MADFHTKCFNKLTNCYSQEPLCFDCPDCQRLLTADTILKSMSVLSYTITTPFCHLLCSQDTASMEMGHVRVTMTMTMTMIDNDDNDDACDVP